MPDPKVASFPPGSSAHNHVTELAQLILLYARRHSISPAKAAALTVAGAAYHIAYYAKDETALAASLDAACKMLRLNATNMFLAREDV